MKRAFAFVLIFAIGITTVSAAELNSFDKYSSVFISTRSIYPAAHETRLASLDAMKRFMATGDLWTYSTRADLIGSIKNLGMSYQGALNITDAAYKGVKGRALDFDGELICAPWMAADNYWGCFNHPDFTGETMALAKRCIDAGVESFQFDDWGGNYRAYDWGGCFCGYCLDGFKEYLKTNYSGSLAGWGIADINAFHYKTYLSGRYSFSGNAAYIAARTTGDAVFKAIDAAFQEFHKVSVVRFHTEFKAALQAYAQKPIVLSNNNDAFMYNPGARFNYLFDVFDFGQSEHNYGRYTADEIITSGSLAAALGKPQVISPKPGIDNGSVMEAETVQAVRAGIAAAYSMGQYMLIPWDIYTGDPSGRYYGRVDQYGDMYHFIRQYDFLFDGYEIPAKIGVLIDWGKYSKASLMSLSKALLTAGVPFRDLVSHDVQPTARLNSGMLTGLSQIVMYTSPNDLSAQSDRSIVNESGIPMVTTAAATAAWLADYSAVSLTGADNIYAVLRAKPGNDNAPKAVHLLNQNSASISGFTLNITNADFFGDSVADAVLYRPGKDPVALTVTNNGEKSAIGIPSVDEWGIVRIFPRGAIAGDEYQLATPFSGLNIGNPRPEGGGSMSGHVLVLQSSGGGLGLSYPDDEGSRDNFSFVYSRLAREDVGRELSCTVNSGPAGGMAGVMFRETPASNARFVSLISENGALKLKWRENDDGGVSEQELGCGIYPVSLKLAFSGDTFTAYKSVNGVDWEEAIGSKSLSMGEMLAGYCASGDSSGAPRTTVIDLDPNAYNQFSVTSPDNGILLSTVTVDVTSNLSGAKKAYCVIAVYDENDNILAMSSVGKRFEPAKTERIKTGFSLADSRRVAYIKAYISEKMPGLPDALCSNELTLFQY